MTTLAGNLDESAMEEVRGETESNGNEKEDTSGGDCDTSDDDAENQEEDVDDDDEGSEKGDGDDDDDIASQSEDSDSSDDDEAGGGLSSLEKRRFERIRRNKEVLSRLGLGDLKPMAKPKQQRIRDKKEIDPGDVRKSSRSKQDVNYADMPARFLVENPETVRDPPPKKNRSGERDKDKRMERFIYDEFLRLRSSQKNDLKMAEKKFRFAQLEHRFAARAASAASRRVTRKQSVQSMCAALESEKLQYGKSLRELLQDIDRRQVEIEVALNDFDYKYMSPERLEHIEKQRLEQERKLEMIDAINGFPNALTEAVHHLNHLLVERAPKDPPPPRQSDRKRRDSSEGKKGSTAVPVSPESDDKTDADEWQNLAALIAAEQPTKIIDSSRSAPDDADDINADPARAKVSKKGGLKRKSTNVGGWVSPTFASQIDRSWLASDAYDSKLNLSTYVPQAGDIILYYPSGHRDFLRQHPDVLGKKLRSKARMPLWERARKEKAKGRSSDDPQTNAPSEKVESTTLSQKQPEWFNDEWLAGVDTKLGDYPLICRVERTHAEFPPHPEVESMVVAEEGVPKVVFKQSKSNKKSKKWNPPLCLVVVLKPMTPLIPPDRYDNSCCRHALSPPPVFHVVTFPSRCAPFIVPFGFGYRIAHSLRLGGMVKLRGENQFCGFVTSFLSMDRYGSGRIEDNASRIAGMLAFFKGEGAATLLSSLESSLLQTSGPKSTLPLAEAGIVIDTMATRTSSSASTAAALTKNEVEGCLITLIRETLPLWKGVSVMLEGGRYVSVSPWDVESSTLLTPSGGAYAALTSHILAGNGLMYYIDEALRAKIECSLEDFAKRNEESYVFWDSVTDDLAPSYSCAVPQGMCFQKIMRRLSHRKVHGQERAYSYYRTLDSLLNDVGSILDNCLLYNSADSDIVLQGFRVIADATKLIDQVVSRHQKEQAAREKADEERRRKITLQYNAAACIQSNPSIGHVAEGKLPKSRRSSHFADVQTMQGPYTVALNRSWIERTDRDRSWSLSADSTQTSVANSTAWVPQSGDAVLYSRLLHSEFIKGHQESLLTEQCNLPQFVLQSGTAISDASVPPAGRAPTIVETTAPIMGHNVASQLDVVEKVRLPGGDSSRLSASGRPRAHRPVAEIRLDEKSSQTTVRMDVVSSPVPGRTAEAALNDKLEAETNNATDLDESLADSIHSQLLVGRIVWVRRVFPRSPSKRDVENDTFDVRSPLLSLGICFDYPWSRGQQTHMVYWRPCMLSNPSGAPDDCICPSCGCQSSFGFLLPAWLYRSPQAESFSRHSVLLPGKVSIDSQSFFSPPSGLDRDTVSAINRCFNALKRRCLAGIPSDFVPENLNIMSVKEGWRPPSKTSLKALPTFEYLFGNDAIGDIDRASNRAVAQNRKSENLEEQEKSFTALAEIHYIPPYSKGPSASKSSTVKGREKKEPGISFEESMCPSPKLSLELIQQRLRNGYYRQKMGLVDDMQEAYVNSVLLVLSKQSSSKFGPCFSLKKFTKSLVKLGMMKTSRSKKEGKTPVNDGALDGFSQGSYEDGRVRSVLLVRSLYAMALASVSATRFFECIFGTSPKKGATPRRREPSAQHHRFMAARQKLSLILTALPRDPGFNRGRAKSLRGANVSGNQEGNVYPSVKIKIVSSLSLVDKNDDLPPIVFSHQDYANLDGLVRCFFGKPGRMNACGRCQVSRRSMLACRVQRGHLNQDFNWDDIMTGVGGIEGLLYTLRYGNPPPPSSSEAQPQAVHVSEEPPSDLASKSEASLQHDAAKAEEDAAKDTQALRLLASASRALLLAETLLASTKKAAELPPRLSDEFIRNSFPIDPADGHYNYCSICGLSGDVICCEKCPVVMHAPCAGSDRVPEGDWFCSKCNASDTKESKLDEKTEVPGQMKAVMIPLDDARARSGELCKKGSQAFSVNDSTQGEEDAATGFGGKTGISGEARKGKGPEDTASDALNQTLDNDDKKKLNLPLEDMQSELDTLLCELRDYRLAQNPARNRKKDDKEEEQQDKITENVANEKESVHDREQETNEDNVIAEKMSTTTMLRRTSVIASERSDEEHPQVSEKGDEPQAIGLGSKVSKDFGENGRFLGVVKALPCEDYPFYKIRYEDGDEEDMDEGELREVLIFIKPPRKRKAIHSDEETPRKRGRTSTQGGSADYSVVKSESARSSASLNETNSPPRPAGKVEFKPGFRSFKPGVRVVPKKLRRQGKTGTIVRSIDRHTWEVRFDDGRKRAPFKSQQLSYLEDVADGFDEFVEPSPAANVIHLHEGVRVFPRKGKWRDKIGTIVKEVSKFTWEVKFDDGIDRGTFKSLQLTFADAGASSQVETAVEDNDDDNHTSSSNRGQSVEFKAGVRVVPKKNIYKFKGATIVRSAGRHKWELKFDDGVDRGLFKTQQLCVLDDNQILPSLDVDTADGVKKEFKVGVRVLPKKRVYQGKLATIIRSCGNHTWELKFDDGVDRGTFTSQQLAYIADSERDAVASSANAHMDFKAGVRVVSKSRIYEGKLGTIVKSVGPEQWTVQFDDGEEPATLTSQQLAVAHSKPGNANSDCDETGQADDVAKTSCEVEGVQKRRRGRPRKAEMLAAIQAVPAIDNDAKSDGYDTGQVDDVAITSHGFDGAQRRRRGRPRKTETLVASTEVLSKSGEKSRVQNSPAVVETRTTPQKRERARRTTTETSIGLGGEGAEAAQRTKRLRTRRSLS